jgi:hypothetical protein
MTRLKLLCFIGALFLLVGCGDDVPPKANVDYGVNWALSSQIQWKDKQRDLFDAYKITNQYGEKIGDERHYVYNFEAQCTVELGPFTMDGGRVVMQKGTSGQQNGQPATLSGSFTLTKKGNAWYCSQTVR